MQSVGINVNKNETFLQNSSGDGSARETENEIEREGGCGEGKKTQNFLNETDCKEL